MVQASQVSEEGLSCIIIMHYRALVFEINFALEKDNYASKKIQVSFSISIGNVELVYDCCSQHLRIGITIMI